MSGGEHCSVTGDACCAEATPPHVASPDGLHGHSAEVGFTPSLQDVAVLPTSTAMSRLTSAVVETGSLAPVSTIRVTLADAPRSTSTHCLLLPKVALLLSPHRWFRHLVLSNPAVPSTRYEL